VGAALEAMPDFISKIERYRGALEQIKRENANYNFGGKLLRIVNAALADKSE